MGAILKYPWVPYQFYGPMYSLYPVLYVPKWPYATITHQIQPFSLKQSFTSVEMSTYVFFSATTSSSSELITTSSTSGVHVRPGEKPCSTSILQSKDTKMTHNQQPTNLRVKMEKLSKNVNLYAIKDHVLPKTHLIPSIIWFQGTPWSVSLLSVTVKLSGLIREERNQHNNR